MAFVDFLKYARLCVRAVVKGESQSQINPDCSHDATRQNARRTQSFRITGDFMQWNQTTWQPALFWHYFMRLLIWHFHRTPRTRWDVLGKPGRIWNLWIVYGLLIKVKFKRNTNKKVRKSNFCRDEWFKRMLNVCLQIKSNWMTLIRASYQYSGLSLSCRFSLFFSSGARWHAGLLCRRFDKLHHMLITIYLKTKSCSPDAWMLDASSLRHSFIILLLSSAPNFCFVKVRIRLRGGFESCISNELSGN